MSQPSSNDGSVTGNRISTWYLTAPQPGARYGRSLSPIRKALEPGGLATLARHRQNRVWARAAIPNVWSFKRANETLSTGRGLRERRAKIAD